MISEFIEDIRHRQTCSVKGQIVNAVGFAGRTVSERTAQLGCCRQSVESIKNWAWLWSNIFLFHMRAVVSWFLEYQWAAKFRNGPLVAVVVWAWWERGLLAIEVTITIRGIHGIGGPSKSIALVKRRPGFWSPRWCNGSQDHVFLRFASRTSTVGLARQ